MLPHGVIVRLSIASVEAGCVSIYGLVAERSKELQIIHQVLGCIAVLLEDGYYVVDKPLPPVQISLCKLTIWASNNAKSAPVQLAKK
jgi:hypothetical protein